MNTEIKLSLLVMAFFFLLTLVIHGISVKQLNNSEGGKTWGKESVDPKIPWDWEVVKDSSDFLGATHHTWSDQVGARLVEPPGTQHRPPENDQIKPLAKKINKTL